LVTVFYTTHTAPDEAKSLSFEEIGKAERFFLHRHWDVCKTILVRRRSGKCLWWKSPEA
jgi:hypothetical protein